MLNKTLTSALAGSALLIGLAFASSTSANPITYSFYGEHTDGAGSATMEIDITGSILIATVSNISPTTLLDGTGTNTPGINGFGFDLTNPIPTLNSWTLTAFNANNVETTIGSGPTDPTGTWDIDGTIAGLTLDFLACDQNPNNQNCNSIQGALYNPTAASGFAALPNWFTNAVLTLNFASAPTLDAFVGNGTCTNQNSCSPFVRFQNVGLNGAGSLRLPGTPGNGNGNGGGPGGNGNGNGGGPGGNGNGNSVPEPATLGLLGLGMLAMGALRRRKVALKS